MKELINLHQDDHLCERYTKFVVWLFVKVVGTIQFVLGLLFRLVHLMWKAILIFFHFLNWSAVISGIHKCVCAKQLTCLFHTSYDFYLTFLAAAAAATRTTTIQDHFTTSTLITLEKNRLLNTSFIKISVL